MALSSEYSRKGLRVKLIREVLKIKSVGELGMVISLANGKLNSIFGMELVKLPKVIKKGPTGQPIQSTQSTQAPSNTQIEGASFQADGGQKDTFSADSIYILKSVLPEEYREKISESAVESRETGYMGFVAIIVSIIAFSGGSIEGPVLTRHTGAVGLDQKLKQTSMQSVEDALKLMQKHLYIEKETKNIEGEQKRQLVKYHLGRRAIREFTKEGLMKHCQQVMKNDYNDGTKAQLDSQLKRTGVLPEAEIVGLPSR